jgi:PmbA protein
MGIYGNDTNNRYDKGMTNKTFTYSAFEFQEIIQDAITQAKAMGATDAAVEVSEGNGLSVSVRNGEVETIERSVDKSMGISIFIGKQRGNASTSDFTKDSITRTIQAAYDIARYTAPDPFAGLAEEDLLEKNPKDLDLFHPWDLTVEEAVDIAKRAEAGGFAVSPMITNSDGASIAANQTHFQMGTTKGFLGGYSFSRHFISCAPIASRGNRKGAPMQRDDWYSASRVPQELADPEAIGRYAAHRALSRLGARAIPTQKCPVIFEAPIAIGLLGAMVQATSGTSLYRKSSFLLESLGKQIFADHIHIHEDPHRLRQTGSTPFDDEGVRTMPRTVVSGGILNGYFLSTYSARKLGMQTTGNSGGAHHLSMTSSRTQAGDDLAGLARKMGRGLIVTELMGQGVNYVTGDYSRGAFGYWVENGVITHPVEEITIAGNLKQMFLDIEAIGTDTLTRGTKETGSILIREMMIGGS